MQPRAAAANLETQAWEWAALGEEEGQLHLHKGHAFCNHWDSQGQVSRA